ncbi:unnamed protein product [Ceutorhynchus assimilis]|uniref:Uncharacterized protein n=1 Tax=Ceutorhynchus assimilis TaxID=467358 RepID=A0A9N9MFH6_9CUCU|nr:unnamed protein product [Ceutorhynchus assimilis]
MWTPWMLLTLKETPKTTSNQFFPPVGYHANSNPSVSTSSQLIKASELTEGFGSSNQNPALAETGLSPLFWAENYPESARTSNHQPSPVPEKCRISHIYKSSLPQSSHTLDGIDVKGSPEDNFKSIFPPVGYHANSNPSVSTSSQLIKASALTEDSGSSNQNPAFAKTGLSPLFWAKYYPESGRTSNHQPSPTSYLKRHMRIHTEQPIIPLLKKYLSSKPRILHPPTSRFITLPLNGYVPEQREHLSNKPRILQPPTGPFINLPIDAYVPELTKPEDLSITTARLQII